MAITFGIIAILIVGTTAYLVKIDHDNLVNEFNKMDTLILLDDGEKYIQALDNLRIVGATEYNYLGYDELQKENDIVIIIKDEINLEETFVGKTSKENIKTIVKLKKQKKTTIKPECLYFRMSGLLP